MYIYMLLTISTIWLCFQKYRSSRWMWNRWEHKRSSVR